MIWWFSGLFTGLLVGAVTSRIAGPAPLDVVFVAAVAAVAFTAFALVIK